MSPEEKALQDADNIVRNAQAGEFINALLGPAVTDLRDLGAALVEATANSLPIFRATVGDEAGDLVALSQVVHTCRNKPARIVAELAGWAIVELAKAKLEANDDQRKPA